MTEESKDKKLLGISETDSPESVGSSASTPTIDGYRIVDKLGEGGMGSVWRAEQLSTHREVAVKVMVSGAFASDKARSRFGREVELAAQLEHPNIARIYESGLHQGKYYYTMELIQGELLDRYVKDKGLTPRQIVELFHDVCRAVQYAHQHGVIHRDLKPSNIIVTNDGQPHILDFGLAKMLLSPDVEDKGKLEVSEDGDIFGTLAYMSPEQAGGHLDQIDTRTDVYSLGIILYRLLTNEWPYDLSGSRYEILRTIQEKDPIRPSGLVAHFDSEIEAILLKTLEKNANQRYQSAAELGHDLHCWLSGLPIVAKSVSSLYLLRKVVARHRYTSTVVALLLVILGSSFLVSLYFYGQTSAVKESLAQQQTEIKARETRVGRREAFSNQGLLIAFLELWHAGNDDAVKNILPWFSPQSRERAATDFLLSPQPLEDKKDTFQKKLSTEQEAFWDFVLGEHYLKHREFTKAEEAYRNCLQGNPDPLESDNWFVIRAQMKLEHLKTLQRTASGFEG
jgi:serine/threonine protein kinase